MSGRTIKVDYIARVEGEARLQVIVDGNDVQNVKLSIFEAPRFFEALLRGRDFREAPDITSRICGICPVAYMMSAVHAMESICGIHVDGPLRELRRLLYCGEWIESHVLHMAMLHLPDFLGYPDSITMAADHPEIVERALRLKKLGNRIVQLVGGREIHPINVRVGGFYKLPPVDALRQLRDELAWGVEAAQETLDTICGLDLPVLAGDWDWLALRPASEYPFNEGALGCSGLPDVAVGDYDSLLTESHVTYTNALQTRRTDGTERPLHLGALARVVHNHATLTPLARAAAAKTGLLDGAQNPYRSIIARSVETLFAFEEALRILDDYTPPDRPYLDVEPCAGTGQWCTEAPRGVLYHRYTLDDSGRITATNIVPPTAVNQRAIEQDLKTYVTHNLDMTDAELRHGCEQVIRNYDPCISCATHFLTLDIQRPHARG